MDWSSGRASSRPGWRSSRAGGCRRRRVPVPAILRSRAGVGRHRDPGRRPRPGPPAAGSVAPPAAPRFELPPPPPSRPAAPSLEDLLGGRVLAWAGGLSLLAGLLFLLVIAISRDWIGEEARTLLAAATSMALLTLGAHAYERRGRTDSALAATATGIAGLFASIVVAVQAYELIPAAAGLALAFAVAATATILAIRWEAEGIAGLGILGAVASPVLVGAGLGARDRRLPVPRHRLGGRRGALAALDLARVRDLRPRHAAVGRLARRRDAEHARDPRHPARVRRPRRRRRRRLRAAHPHGDGRLRPASAARAQRARAGVDRLGRAVGDRRGHRRPRAGSPASRSRTSPARRPAGAWPASRATSRSPPPCSASRSRTSRSPRWSTACRSSPAGRPPAWPWPRSSARRRTASTPRSRSPASASTSASRSGTCSSTTRR